ncbi:MAG: T9SS type A sorting domain-containing protein, partial [Anaerolineales bacterium]|nr:T9SS type A sorting domain-containing protein [Anaerolineales bacterium]
DYKIEPRVLTDIEYCGNGLCRENETIANCPSDCDGDECGAEPGDLNGDGSFNVLDVVILSNCILSQSCGQGAGSWSGSDCGEAVDCYGCAGDLNEDTSWNVLDVVILSNCILSQSCGGRIDDATLSRLMINGNMVSIEADGFIGGVQMTLSHGDDFKVQMTDRALFADYLTSGSETRLLIITPETDKLFSYSGDFEITELIVANSHAEVATSLPLTNSFSLSQAYPNPFNPTTTMTLIMPVAGDMKVEIYNLLGQSIATMTSGYKDAGTYTLIWDAADAASGMYFVKA